MGKSRMTAVDLAVVANDLHKTILGYKVVNIYDLNPRTFVFKMSGGSEKPKVLLLIESGVRIHSTLYEREHPGAPHGFTQKLRKSCRQKRVDHIEQLGVDRVIIIRFGSGENAIYLISEFYAAGNIILTDHKHVILAALRTAMQDKRTTFDVGDVYDMQKARQRPVLSRDYLLDCITGFSESKKTAKQFLMTKLWYGGDVIEHCLLESGIMPGNKKPDSFEGPNFGKFLTSLESIERALFGAESSVSGFVILGEWIKMTKNEDEGGNGDDDVIYDSFVPYLYKQFQNGDGDEKESKHHKYRQWNTFNEALDAFFSKIETQKDLLKRRKEEQGAAKMVEKVKSTQIAHLSSLNSELSKREHQAQLIEANLDIIDRAILIIRSHLARGIDWVELEGVVADAKVLGDEAALLIEDLKLNENRIVVSLRTSSGGDDVDGTPSSSASSMNISVEIDLALSAYANAAKYYAMRKKAEEKHQKTAAAADTAVKAAEKRALKQLEQGKTTSSIRQIRKKHWFEKFNWFITSENYLVISGRDAQQNELLVKKYLDSRDVYVHADAHGASTCIVKNRSSSNSSSVSPISPVSLIQAGVFSVCRSVAWKNKIVTSAYWVYANQVSKSAPSGEYLPAGSFMIRGKKNYLPPNPLVMGLGVLFRPDDSCLVAHLNERTVKVNVVEEGEGEGEGEDDGKEEALNVNVTNVLGADTTEEMVVAEGEGEGEGEAECDGEADNIGVEDEHNESTDADAAEAEVEVEVATDKYNLDDFGEEDEENERRLLEKLDVAVDGVSQSRKYVTAKQRRQQKKEKEKGKGKEEKGNEEEKEEKEEKEEREEREEVQDTNQHQHQQTTHPPTLPASAPKRGKKAKLKRFKKKYAHQDEEDRHVALKLVGSKGLPREISDSLSVATTVSATASENEQGNESEGEGESSTAPVNVTCYLCGNTGQKSFECPEKEKAKEKENGEEGEGEGEGEGYLEQSERSQLDEIDLLTGIPLPTDTLLYAIPVCAPYSAIQNYKFKVKLQPGSSKRGKAVRSVADSFVRNGVFAASKFEGDLIKSITDSEWMLSMLSDVKVIFPTMTDKGKGKGKGKAKKGKGKK